MLSKSRRANDPLPSVVPFFIGGNFVSPTYYITWVLKHTINIDPFDWASKQVAGDWEAVRKAADAATNLGSFNDDFAKVVNTDWTNMLDQSWHGHAADGAKSYFQGLSNAVKWQVSDLQEIGHELTNTANSMMNLSRSLGDLLQTLADLALLWAATEAAAACTGVVGEVAGVAVSAAYVIMMLARYDEMISKVETVYKAVVASVALLEGLSSHTSADKLPALPNNAYQFPGV